MLRMSKLADYGTVIMTAMARDPDAVHSASSITAATGVAMPTVAKVLKVLTRGGVVESLRGTNGGYLLPRPPTRITLAEVIAAVDGPIGITECSTMPGLCIQEGVRGARQLAEGQSRDLRGVAAGHAGGHGGTDLAHGRYQRDPCA